MTPFKYKIGDMIRRVGEETNGFKKGSIYKIVSTARYSYGILGAHPIQGWIKLFVEDDNNWVSAIPRDWNQIMEDD